MEELVSQAVQTPLERADCPLPEELRAYAEEQLDAAQALQIAEHLVLCQRCRRQVAAYGTSESG
ncbi:MAG: hypothetical protein HY335_01975 [Deinococcus sp.]|nr:hypothetical protein [Deinococcus sp.]